jgi:hypothetical protein
VATISAFHWLAARSGALLVSMVDIALAFLIAHDTHPQMS